MVRPAGRYVSTIARTKNKNKKQQKDNKKRWTKRRKGCEERKPNQVYESNRSLLHVCNSAIVRHLHQPSTRLSILFIHFFFFGC
jgi:hypothetical protein